MNKEIQQLVDKGEMLPLMEEFYTIQGEGYHKGTAAYFIRIGGCDVGCHWCDVKESWNANLHPPTETNKIVGLEEFNLLKKDSYFINVGRGKTVNEFELISALNNSILTGAILDVFYKEPLSINSKLWKLDNVLISPHVAGITNPTNYAAALLRSNFNALINDKNIKNKVNNTKGY